MSKKLTWKEWGILIILIFGVLSGIYSIIWSINDYNAKKEKIRNELIEVAKDGLMIEMHKIALDGKWYGIMGKNIEKAEIEKRIDKACDQFIEKIKKYNGK